VTASAVGQARVDKLPDPVDITRLMWTTPR